MQFRPDQIQAGPRRFLSPSGTGDYLLLTVMKGPTYSDSYFQRPHHQGPLWFFAGYTPQYWSAAGRSIISIRKRRLSALRTFRQKVTREYAFARLDADLNT